MNACLRAFVALSAAVVVCACAQGCGGWALERRGATATASATTVTFATPTPAAQSVNASQTPEPYAPPYPALKRGEEAFEPVLRMSDGRTFERYKVSHKPLRKDRKLDADYPVLVGDSGRAARELNRLTREFVLDEVTPFVESGPDTEKASNSFWKDVEESLSVSHKVVYASDELVSVLFYVEGYNWGAAHSYHHLVTFNFDMKKGRELRLADLFKHGSRHLERVRNLCDEDLRRQFGARYPSGEQTSLEEGLKPKARNFSSWVVTPGGLVFIFAEYQVVSYADGEPKVLIPFERLKEIMKPEGALAALASGAE